MLVRTRLARPHMRTWASAWVRRRALGVWAHSARVSDTQSPAQSPYTPLVEPYTKLRGRPRKRKARINACVRGSVCASCGGGARCTSRVARPASLRRLCAASKFPRKGVRPIARSSATRPDCEVSAKSRTLPRKHWARRNPTSPQPTINTRSRRKRAGKAPRGVWFEGKIAYPFKYLSLRRIPKR